MTFVLSLINISRPIGISDMFKFSKFVLAWGAEEALEYQQKT